MIGCYVHNWGQNSRFGLQIMITSSKCDITRKTTSYQTSDPSFADPGTPGLAHSLERHQAQPSTAPPCSHWGQVEMCELRSCEAGQLWVQTHSQACSGASSQHRTSGNQPGSYRWAIALPNRDFKRLKSTRGKKWLRLPNKIKYSESKYFPYLDV